MQTHISTKDLAKALSVQPATIRRALCTQGHYLGLTPQKLPNHRLCWPADGLRRLLGQ